MRRRSSTNRRKTSTTWTKDLTNSMRQSKKSEISNVTIDQSVHKTPHAPLNKSDSTSLAVALPFHNAESLREACTKENLSISQLVYLNELQWRRDEDVKARTLAIWRVMESSIENGIKSTAEYLPGTLGVKRRAPMLYKKLMSGFSEYAGLSRVKEEIVKETRLAYPRQEKIFKKSLPALDWISLYAISVNEEVSKVLYRMHLEDEL